MQYKSIEDFYLHLPEEILQRAFELDYNSKIKKAIDSVKNNSTKLKKIMADRISRRKFIDFLYQEYNVAEKDYKSITDVLAMVDKDNIIESIIYVIHEYLDDNKLNMNFNLIANKVDELQKSNINDDNKVLKDNVLQLKNKLSDNNSSENGIKSIVVLKREREFFNIYPLAELQDNYIRTIEKSERQEKYPSYGNINVYVSYNSNLRNIDIDEEELKVFKFSKEDLNDTGLGSRYQIDEKYILDKNNFYSIEKDNIFRCYTLDYLGKYRFYEEEEFVDVVKDGEYILENLKESNRFDYKGHSYKYTKFGNISKSDTQRDVEVEIPQDDINIIINGESAHLDLIYKFETKKLEDHIRITTRISEKNDDISCILYIDYNQGNEFVKELEGVKKAQQENMNK